jgi:MFS family permease
MTTLSEPLVTPKYGKWRQLVLSLICMAAISSPQYVWTLLTNPGRQTGRRSARIAGHLLAADHPADLLFPFSGRLVEKFGPRRLIAIGTVMAGNELGAFRAGEWPGTLWLVYGCMGGLGTGIVYIGVVGLMVKWFPQQRDLPPARWRRATGWGPS